MRLPSVALLAPAILAASANARFIMYADEWHPDRPTSASDRAGIDHIVLAFAQANQTATWMPKPNQPLDLIRQEFPGAKIMVAIGGWGDTVGFSEAVLTTKGMEQFAEDVKTLIERFDLDGVDIDWEYPGGNGADYKQVPNSARTNEIEAFPEFLKAIRAAIGDDKLLSIAVPGKEIDMIAFTPEQGPKIWPSVDYINIMTYDLMNRRDTHTAHHTSLTGSTTAIKNYLSLGAPPQKINLGFGFYAKYFTTATSCTSTPLSCPILPAEDPITGKDTLTSGAWTFEKWHMTPVDTGSLAVSIDGTCGAQKGTKCAGSCCSQYGNCGTSPEHCSGACQHAFGVGCTDADVAGSWQRALADGSYDEKEGGQYFFDAEENLFWTWDTEEIIGRKIEEIVGGLGLGGVMAWSLGEDSFDWGHIRKIAEEMEKLEEGDSEYGPPQEDYGVPEEPEPRPKVDVVLNDGSDEEGTKEEELYPGETYQEEEEPYQDEEKGEYEEVEEYYEYYAEDEPLEPEEPQPEPRPETQEPSEQPYGEYDYYEDEPTETESYEEDPYKYWEAKDFENPSEEPSGEGWWERMFGVNAQEGGKVEGGAEGAVVDGEEEDGGYERAW